MERFFIVLRWAVTSQRGRALSAKVERPGIGGTQGARGDLAAFERRPVIEWASFLTSAA
jgi:hypothetical protein